MDDKNLMQKVDELHGLLSNPNEKKKSLKLMRKAKVKKAKLKKGWMGVIQINENGNLSGEKVKVEDFAYKVKKGNYHATDGSEKVWWNGKHPVLFQPTWRLNPIDLRKKEGEKNETYGQKYVMAKMMKDAIKIKQKAGSFLIWILVAVAGFVAYSLITGGK